MGDATADTETALFDLYGEELSADILKVSHHGSGNSSTVAFLSAVLPSFAVISCGEGNVYGFPAPDVLRRLGEIGCTVYRTDINGTVVLTASRLGEIHKK